MEHYMSAVAVIAGVFIGALYGAVYVTGYENGKADTSQRVVYLGGAVNVPRGTTKPDICTKNPVERSVDGTTRQRLEEAILYGVPSEGDFYYIPMPDKEKMYGKYIWSATSVDIEFKKRGLVCRTEDEAVCKAKLMIRAIGGSYSEKENHNENSKP